ncbi:MAG: hypothetical protein KBT36_12930 [Kurthia sp.]|nr:hypothetical protein [Candidatus Kurthia equi]
MDLLKKIGFSTGDLLKILYLQQTKKAPINATELHALYTQFLPGVEVGYEYVSKIGRQLETANAINVSHTIQKKKYYTITSTGADLLTNYENLYYGQFSEIAKVFERIDFHLTRKGQAPSPFETPLPSEFRRFFAKLVSVRDITRYMIFYLGDKRTDFYAAEALEQMDFLFGWSPSNGYFYDIVREMESEQTIVGKWKDPEKRTIRLIRVTNDGVVFAKQVRSSLAEQVSNVRIHLNSIQMLFDA